MNVAENNVIRIQKTKQFQIGYIQFWDWGGKFVNQLGFQWLRILMGRKGNPSRKNDINKEHPGKRKVQDV